MRTLFVLIFSFICTTTLHAEIQKVVLGYTEGLCDKKCMQLLQQRFKALPEVSSVNVTPGEVQLQWKPNQPFNFSKLDGAMRMVGVGMANTSVTVRGTITVQGDKVYLTSLGDNTKFELTNPPKPSAQQYIEFNNIANYKLYPEVRDALKTAMKNHQVVVATGTLLGPWRYGLTLVLGNYQVETAPNTNTPPNANQPPNRMNFPSKGN